MDSQYLLKKGSSGEILLPKEVREYLNIKEDQSVLMKVYPNRLIIQKVDSLEESLNQPTDSKVSHKILKSLENEFD